MRWRAAQRHTASNNLLAEPGSAEGPVKGEAKRRAKRPLTGPSADPQSPRQVVAATADRVAAGRRDDERRQAARQGYEERADEDEDERKECMTQAGDNRMVASEAPIPERGSVEVRPPVRRRQFSVGYRRRIVEEAASMTPTERGALLRREGLDSSHLVRWKAEMKMNQGNTRAEESGLRRGPKPDPKLAEIRQLERENARLTAKLKQAELIIDAQKKLAEIFGAGAGAMQPAEMAMDRSIGGR